MRTLPDHDTEKARNRYLENAIEEFTTRIAMDCVLKIREGLNNFFLFSEEEFYAEPPWYTIRPSRNILRLSEYELVRIIAEYGDNPYRRRQVMP